MPSANRHPTWIFVINNYTDEDIKAVKEVKCEAITCGYEVGEKGTPHIQGAIYWGSKKGKSCGATCKALGGRANVRPMSDKATWEDNLKYTQKDNNILRVEGEGPQQGKRNDLIGCKRKLDEGASLLDLYEHDFACTAKYSRAFKEYMDLKNRGKYRTEMTTCMWIYGDTGVGKSHMAFLDMSDTYVWKDDNGWWDGYEGQSIVVINDFRGEIKYNELLKMIDKWPYDVRRRCREPAPFVSKRVIITSSLPPDKVYWKRDEKDKIAQLLRRITVKELK